MAANIEHAVLTRAIQDGDFHTLEKSRITDEYFSTAECKEVFRFLYETFHHPVTTGQVPSQALVHSRFPAFFFAQAYDTVPVLVQELKREKARMELKQLAAEIDRKGDADPMEAIASLRAEAVKLSALMEVNNDISVSGAYHLLLNRYEAIAAAQGVLGIPYPWEVLNEETQGMQGGQFIVFYGRPKSMKTWTAIEVAVHAYIRARRRVLLYSREMSQIELLERVAVTIAKVDYKAFRKGRLQPDVKERVFTILKELVEDEKAQGSIGSGHMPMMVVVSDKGVENAGGVSWLQSKIRDYKPDMVLVDGMYLMSDDRSKSRSTDWRQIAHISQDLKITAQQYDVPIIGITQANRSAEKGKGDDLTELAFADSIGQDADAVFRIIKIKNKETGLTELIIKAPGLREGTFDGMVIAAQPGVSFRFLRAYRDGDEQQEDTSEEGKKPGYGEGKGKNSTVRPTPTFRPGGNSFMPVDPTIPLNPK